MINDLASIPLEDLHSHPDNPRLLPRDDVIEAIRSSIEASAAFDPAHAPIVRPRGDGFQIVSGHQRVEAARRAGLVSVPCWVRDLDDAAAYMLLATSNAQGELSALEIGLHALHSALSQQAYGKKINLSQPSVSLRIAAAAVVDACVITDVIADVAPRWRHLAEIHAAPRWLWPALVRALLARGWTVEATRVAVGRFGTLTPTAPVWLSDEFADGLVDGTVPVRDIVRIEELCDRIFAELEAVAAETGEGEAARPEADRSFSRYSDALDLCNSAVDAARRKLSDFRRSRAAEQKSIEDAAARAARLFDSVSLDEWKSLDDGTRRLLLAPDPDAANGHFLKQTGDGIEWAQWSWNPITGCEHTCPYCYARDLAMGRASAAYPHGFAPAFRPRALLTPRNMRVSSEAARDARFRNVFIGSMADMFGRWVPSEWIEAVLSEVRAAAEWNFLCLTKFPKRMAEFDIPPNMWMGTTVDLQARIRAAEDAFVGVRSKVKWLSCEPLIEPLKFRHLERFDWLVIGGASKQSATPEWRPPFRWVADLTAEAHASGLKVYHKANLLGSRVLELPADLPVVGDPQEAPAVFHYLGKNS